MQRLRKVCQEDAATVELPAKDARIQTPASPSTQICDVPQKAKELDHHGMSLQKSIIRLMTV